MPSQEPPAAHPISPPLIYLIKRLHAAMRTAVDRELEPDGLTLTQAVVLAGLAHRPGMSNADLARAGSVSPQSMVEVLGVLERRGLVRRRPSDAGGRTLCAELTLAGHAEFDKTRAAALAVEATLLSPFSPADQARLREMLEASLEALKSSPPPASGDPAP